jgi:hypothetical protein
MNDWKGATEWMCMICEEGSLNSEVFRKRRRFQNSLPACFHVTIMVIIGCFHVTAYLPVCVLTYSLPVYKI